MPGEDGLGQLGRQVARPGPLSVLIEAVLIDVDDGDAAGLRGAVDVAQEGVMQFVREGIDEVHAGHKKPKTEDGEQEPDDPDKGDVPQYASIEHSSPPDHLVAVLLG